MISVKEDLIPVQKRFAGEYHLKDALAALNHPEANIKTINVVGTNGKGSVSKFLSLGLEQKYPKIGVFTSPAFLYQNERIAVNQTLISDEELDTYLQRINSLINQYHLTFFEIWTLIAILYFRDQKVDYAVVEAGIGGIKDATYLFSNQVATLLTAVDFDHTEVLGTRIEEILTNKVLMAKPHSKLYISHDNLAYQATIHQILAGKNVEQVMAGLVDDQVLYQQANKGLVKTFLEQEFGLTNFEFLTRPAPFGRFQILSNETEPLFLIDGAHNPNGISALVQSFKTRFPEQEPIVLVGCSAHKDYQANLTILAQNFKNLYVTGFDHFHAWNLNDVQLGVKVNDWPEFLQAQRQAQKDIVVCGSLYFVPLVEEWYQNNKEKTSFWTGGEQNY